MAHRLFTLGFSANLSMQMGFCKMVVSGRYATARVINQGDLSVNPTRIVIGGNFPVKPMSAA
jgi:hypothetical protein